jgi:TfoX/Sxy family transcriptional regulator of competence genes
MAYDEELADRLRAALAGHRGVTEKKMFGGLAFLIGGHMAVSASSQGGLLLRVDPSRTADLTSEPNAAPFVMRGREMDGWLRVDPAGLGSEEQLRRWVELGVTYASSLPPK